MELTNQVATLQDEVKLLKGEIKSILKEIRTAVLSQDNPFSVGLEAVQVPNEQSRESTPAQEPALPAPAPKPIEPAPIVPAPLAPAPLAPAFQVPPMPQMNSPQPPIMIQGGAPPAPNWAGPVPASQPAPAPFTPSAAPAPLAPPIKQSEPDAPALAPPKSARRAAEVEALEAEEPEEMEAVEEADNEPIPIRSAKKQVRRAKQQDEQSLDEEAALEAAPVAAPARERPAWSLPTIAGLAVWAEDALVTLGPRRFQFVLELATFAELLSSDAREVLASLIEADTLSHEDERPLNVNECLVVLRQLEAIVHGEKVIKLPRRRGIRHRRIR